MSDDGISQFWGNVYCSKCRVVILFLNSLYQHQRDVIDAMISNVDGC